MSRLHARVLALLALALGPLAPAARAQDGLVIDVRDPVSFSEGHHPGDSGASCLGPLNSVCF